MDAHNLKEHLDCCSSGSFSIVIFYTSLTKADISLKAICESVLTAEWEVMTPHAAPTLCYSRILMMIFFSWKIQDQLLCLISGFFSLRVFLQILYVLFFSSLAFFSKSSNSSFAAFLTCHLDWTKCELRQKMYFPFSLRNNLQLFFLLLH